MVTKPAQNQTALTPSPSTGNPLPAGLPSRQTAIDAWSRNKLVFCAGPASADLAGVSLRT